MKVNRDNCCYCGTCANICPKNAIELLDIPEVELNPKICNKCTLCIKVCPVGAVEVG